MRLSASRIRSINRAIARVQSSAWSAPDRNRHRSLAKPALTHSVNVDEFERVVVDPSRATL
jgi:hypothetical protein